MTAFDSFFIPYDNVGLLILRLVIAAIFLYHGPKKLNGSMGSFMTFIGVCETLGALAMLFGFLTQLASLGLAIIMVGAAYKKINEWHVPFASQKTTGWELDLMIFGGCIAILTLGAGIYSVDYMLLGL